MWYSANHMRTVLLGTFIPAIISAAHLFSADTVSTDRTADAVLLTDTATIYLGIPPRMRLVNSRVDKVDDIVLRERALRCSSRSRENPASLPLCGLFSSQSRQRAETGRGRCVFFYCAIA